MKKMTALLLVMALTLAMVIPASASEVESEIMISGAEILSVQEMSHAEADAMLAELLGASENMVAPCGTSAPSSSSVWDLSVKSIRLRVTQRTPQFTLIMSFLAITEK